MDYTYSTLLLLLLADQQATMHTGGRCDGRALAAACPIYGGGGGGEVAVPSAAGPTAALLSVVVVPIGAVFSTVMEVAVLTVKAVVESTEGSLTAVVVIIAAGIGGRGGRELEITVGRAVAVRKQGL